ncbi:DEAD-box ATP-dependent RNA helicase CshA [compost metagenome]
MIVQAQTGTGKTLAFLLPIIERISVERPDAQALIITPTRELALQITVEARKLAEGKEGLSILAAYGGQDVERQLRKLKNGTQLIIGTPGRLLDHLRRGSLQLGAVKWLVLDEADQMLHMGFLAEVEDIISNTPYNRQTMLFSATMPDNVKRLAQAYMKQPKDIKIAQTSRQTLDSIKQIVISCTDRGKQNALIESVRTQRPYLAVIFCRTKRRASTLNEALQTAGFASDELHGDLSQSKREQVMRAFREAKLELLVATDVAARGIDVEGVTHVYNYDIPQDVESYIHRIGRTGRAGEKGVAITFASPRDMEALRIIEQGISKRLERQTFHGEVQGAPSSRNESDAKRGDRSQRSQGGRFGREEEGQGRRQGRGRGQEQGRGRGRDQGQGTGSARKQESARGGSGANENVNKRAVLGSWDTAGTPREGRKSSERAGGRSSQGRGQAGGQGRRQGSEGRSTGQNQGGSGRGRNSGQGGRSGGRGRTR